MGKVKDGCCGCFKDFKDFINKGNVIDLAVALILGAAFTAIVKSLVTDILNPIIGLIGAKSLEQLFHILRQADGVPSGTKYNTVEQAHEAGAITLNYGRFIDKIIYFLIVAFVLFIIIKLLMMTRKKEAVAPTTDWSCPKCKEIVKEGATKCPHCTAEPIANEVYEDIPKEM